jgi:hypothetical protein
VGLERLGERHTALQLLADVGEDGLEPLVVGALLDHPHGVDDRDAGAHEGRHLPGEVHHLLARHALRRDLDLGEALLLLDLQDLEVLTEEIVLGRGEAHPLDGGLDLLTIRATAVYLKTATLGSPPGIGPAHAQTHIRECRSFASLRQSW